ncbi:MAG: hypothetical protein IPL83_15930 [Bdellovibrionales bacterium]|nr:hypothetical protein [Bdellovibrionales bacterium]
MPKNLQDLMDSAIGLGDVHYDKIHEKLKAATGIKSVLQSKRPLIRQIISRNFSKVDWWRPSGLLVETGAGKFRISRLNGLSGTLQKW